MCINHFNKLSKNFRFLLIVIISNILILSLLRFYFYFIFSDYNDANIPNLIIIKSFYIGLKFDIRLILCLYLPLLIIGKYIKRWLLYFNLIHFILITFYVSDFGYYAYLQNNRLDATVIRFLYNLKDSLTMILESYPVGIFIFGLGIWFLIYALFLFGIKKRVNRNETIVTSKKVRFSITLVYCFIYLFGIYGKLSYYPLRWCDAYFSNYNFASVLALNPVLYFFDTLKNREVKYDKEIVKKYYPIISDYLNIKNKESLNFTREINPLIKENKTNIIFVLLESFAFYKLGLSGNPLNPTPNFDNLAKNSILFTRFYTPHGGTARSVFTFLTGIPDVENIRTSSRNPLVVKQHTIFNAFKNHQKFYFLGGSANWGNIRGLLSNNIKDLKIYEEGDFNAPRGDVWGISDLDLFKESIQILRTNKNPFVAFIHTAGNHKPYTIPKENHGFKKVSYDEEFVTQHGFRSLAALNAFRFMDHSIGIFIEKISKEPFFENTIFAFFGDHGLLRNVIHIPPGENILGLTDYHVPFMIYSPKFIKNPRKYDFVASEVDILPTIASLTGTPYINTTFGRDLLDIRDDKKHYAFSIIHRNVHEIQLIGNNHFFAMNEDGSNKRLHDIYSDDPLNDIKESSSETADEMEKYCLGIYETAKYIRFHNNY
ncbi:hypothetical protein BVX93_00240 [bacterium B13(2017)]|nr:hypothetical protein BVX93_00240 [bacterium B13(2017)]